MGRGRTIFVVAAALALAACGGGGLPDIPAIAPDRLPFDGTFVDMTGEQLRFANRIVAEVAAECMRQRGFNYVVETQTGSPQPHLPGWGISTQFGHERGRPAPGVEARPGTNTAIFKTLSSEEQVAYNLALHGSDADRVVLKSPDGGEISFYSPDSCIGRGNSAAYGDMAKILLAQEKIQLAYNELEDRIQSDPRLIKALDSWAECMADSGFEVSRPEEAAEQIAKRLTALADQGLVPSTSSLPIDATHGTYAANSVVGSELARLQEDEIRLFDLVADCDRRVGLNDLELKVRSAYELPFAEDNAELIEDLRLPNLAEVD